MKIPVLLAAALVAAAPAARADEKSDAILKEVRLRAANATTYSVTIAITQQGKMEKMSAWIQKPGMFRSEIAEDDGVMCFVTDGKLAAVINKGNVRRVPVSAFESDNRLLKQMMFGIVDFSMDGVAKTEYVTQKMLDDMTRVDVIDVWGKRAGTKMRIYIDNNSQVRRIVGRDNRSSGTIDLLDPTIDEPIPAEKFFVPDKPS